MLSRNYKGPSKCICLRHENFVMDRPWIKDWQEQRMSRKECPNFASTVNNSLNFIEMESYLKLLG